MSAGCMHAESDFVLVYIRIAGLGSIGRSLKNELATDEFSFTGVIPSLLDAMGPVCLLVARSR